MAIAAIDAVIANVMFVRELDRLLSRNKRAGHVGGSIYLYCGP
jgi:hypothetical protein